MSQQTNAIAIGYQAGNMSQGTNAIAIGNSAGYSNQGTYAVAIGYQAGETNQGQYAVAIGYKAGYTNQANSSVAIGSNSQASLANQIVLGTSLETVYCPGTNSYSTYGFISLIAVSSILSAGTVIYSDYRIKQDVCKIPPYPNIDNLNPVMYQNMLTGKQDMGFIAHELQEHFPFLVLGEKDGFMNQSVNYIGLIALLTKEIQDLKKEIREMKNGK